MLVRNAIYRHRGHHIKSAFAFALALGFTACTTVQLGDSETKAPIKKFGLGFILIEDYTGASGLKYEDEVMVGAWVAPDGIGLGYESKHHILADQKCQVVFLIKNQKELEQAHRLLEKTIEDNKGSICLGKY